MKLFDFVINHLPIVLVKYLPATWYWVRRRCGGHWETRCKTIPPLGASVKRYVWWEQFDECQYCTFPPAYECEEYGEVIVWHHKSGNPPTYPNMY